jgi:hypothetical protein
MDSNHDLSGGAHDARHRSKNKDLFGYSKNQNDMTPGGDAGARATNGRNVGGARTGLITIADMVLPSPHQIFLRRL